MAVEGLRKQSCGGCGGSDYRLYKNQADDPALFFECIKCKSLVRLQVNASYSILDTDYTNGSPCDMGD